MQMQELTVADFSDQLASKAPVPGGGGAAALMGTLAAALCAMVGNLTSGKKKYASVEADIRQLIGKAEILRVRFLELAEEDAAAFAPLAKAYSLPKSAPDYAVVMRKCTMDACRAPMEMMRCSCRAIDLLEEMLQKGSKLMISDVGCGAIAAKAALESAAMNVWINTKSLREDPEAESMNGFAEDMLAEYSPRADQITNEVKKHLKMEA